jgi:hypothetical protein
MSKKSRRRNKKILGALGALGALAMLGNRKPKQSSVSADSVRGSGLRPTVDDMEFKETVVATPVSTKTTIMDSMPARPKLNEKSIRVKDGKVFTIEGAKKGVPSKISGIDTPGIYVNKKGNITAGGKQFYDKNQYRTRNDKPGMLGDSGFTRKKSVMASPDLNTGAFDIGFKKGGRVKGCGKALRGYGRAMKGKK